MAGVMLYAGEGAKRDGNLLLANSDPRMISLFCAWLRHFFEIDESRLRVRLYLHQGLDLDAAVLYGCSRTHRAVMGLVHALLESQLAIPG
jgi:hypothetical protein